MTGRHTMWAGFGKSVNTFFVQLEERVGPEAAVRMAERLGLRWHTDIDRIQASPAKARTWGAFTLGVADTTPLEMAGAYATVAADGKYCAPLPVISVTSAATGRVASTPAPAVRAGDLRRRGPRRPGRGPLRDRVQGGDRAMPRRLVTAPGVYKIVGRPVAGKTGTTDDNRAIWFIGMTPGLTAAGFIADPDNPFHAVAAGDRTKPRESVAYMLRDALAGTPAVGFTAPSPQVVGKAAKSGAKKRRT